MMEIALAAVPNQSFTVQILEKAYDIALREANGVMSASLARDGVALVTNMRATAGTPLLPYRYEEAGNFIITTEGEALPYYDQFGVTQFLIYLTAEELAAYRNA